MYTDFFQLTAKPFELLPNPEFLFLSKGHKRALTFLEYGIRAHTGFILLTGEIGSGKTTLIRDLIERQGQEVILAKVFNTRVDSQQLVSLICDDFGLDVRGKTKFDLLRDLNEFLIEQYAARRQAVLIIDEAQNLAADLLEEIRMLSNLETADAKLLQIILVGQPELRDILAVPELLQLRQRISVNCHLNPLSAEECAEYLAFRLEKAGNRDALEFSPAAVDLIHRYSRGIPRLINILGEYLLIDAFAAGQRQVDGQMVKTIADEIQFERMYWQSEARLETDADLPDAAAQGGRNRKAPLAILKLLLDIQNRLKALDLGSPGADTAVLDRLDMQVLPRLEALETAVAAIASPTAAASSGDAVAAVQSALADHHDRLQQRLDAMLAALPQAPCDPEPTDSAAAAVAAEPVQGTAAEPIAREPAPNEDIGQPGGPPRRRGFLDFLFGS